MPSQPRPGPAASGAARAETLGARPLRSTRTHLTGGRSSHNPATRVHTALLSPAICSLHTILTHGQPGRSSPRQPPSRRPSYSTRKRHSLTGKPPGPSNQGKPPRPASPGSPPTRLHATPAPLHQARRFLISARHPPTARASTPPKPPRPGPDTHPRRSRRLPRPPPAQAPSAGPPNRCPRATRNALPTARSMTATKWLSPSTLRPQEFRPAVSHPPPRHDRSP